jgi:hypothetical protein
VTTPGDAPTSATAQRSAETGTQGEEAVIGGAASGLRAVAALLVLTLAGGVDASPGNGIRMGGSTARLHPFLELEGRYDSNIAFSDQGQRQAGFILHVRPGLSLISPSGPAAVDFTANADWAQYSGANKGLSRLYGEAQLGVGLNRRGEVGLELTDVFRRSRRTQVLVLGGAVMANINELDVAVPWRPGGGALTTTLSGGWTLQTFEPFVSGRLCAADTPQCNPSLVSRLNYSDVSGKLEVRWRFLPKTAVVTQGEYWKRMPQDAGVGGEASGWRAMAGLAGLFSAHLAGTVKGGWATSTVTGASTSTWYANVEGEWIPTETVSAKLGYLHDSNADPGIGGGYEGHRAYLDAKALLDARYTTRLSLQYERRSYRGSAVVRTADLISASPSIDAEVTRWLRAGVGMAYTRRTSTLVAGTPPLPGFKFDKTEVFLRVRGTY